MLITPHFVRIVLVSAAFVCSSLNHAESGTVRLGLGASHFEMRDGPQGAPSGIPLTSIIFAEFAQSNYAASRFKLYHQDSQDTHLTGAETQLLLGYGLADPGLRIYTGPTWHLEHLHLPPSDQSHSTRGWALQTGIGYQIGSVAVDYAFSWRDKTPYNRLARRQGYKFDSVVEQTLLISYQF